MVEPLEIMFTISAKKIDSSKSIILDEIGDRDIINNGCGTYFEVQRELSDNNFEEYKEILESYNNFTNYLRKYNPTLTAIQVTHTLQLKGEAQLSKANAKTDTDEPTEDDDNIPF